jgi:hypothetical protein
MVIESSLGSIAYGQLDTTPPATTTDLAIVGMGPNSQS